MAFYWHERRHWGGAAWRQNLHPFLSARILQIQDLLVEKTNLSAALRTRFLVVSAKDDNGIFTLRPMFGVKMDLLDGAKCSK